MKNKLELFIANWSYSYDLKRVFATYQRMRANRTTWAGTLLNSSVFLLITNSPKQLGIFMTISHGKGAMYFSIFFSLS